MAYTNEELCKRCGGKCCHNTPGHYLPSDFENLRKEAVEGLSSGTMVIDFAEMYFCELSGQECSLFGCCESCNKSSDSKYHRQIKEVKFLRARGVNEKTYDANGSAYNGGQCTHLTSSGCRLPFKERPYFCRVLKPDPINCHIEDKDSPGSVWAYTYEKWLPYQKVVEEVEEEITNQLRAEILTEVLN